MDDFYRERQSMPELKGYFRAIRQTPQSVEQMANLALQLKVSGADSSCGGVLAAEARYLNDPHLVIENWLTASNRHVLDSAELVSLHQLH